MSNPLRSQNLRKLFNKQSSNPNNNNKEVNAKNNYYERTKKIINNNENNNNENNNFDVDSSNKNYGIKKLTSQEKILEDKNSSKNLRNVKSPIKNNRKASQEKNLEDKNSSKDLKNVKTPIKINKKASQEKNLGDKYSSKDLKNIKSPNRKASQKKNLGDKYSSKDLKNIKIPINNNNYNRRASQENNNILRKNSQIKDANRNIEKKKLLIIINFENKKKNNDLIKLYISFIEEECKIVSNNNIQIEYLIMNYDDYQKKKEEEDFFKIYFIFFFVPKNELYKNSDKIFEIEDDIENYNPFIQLGVITVIGINMESYIDLPQFPFSDYSEIIKKYEKFKERKNDSKYKIITYYPEFYVYKEKNNKIIVKIFYPYVFSEFSNDDHEDIISKQFFDDNIYIKSNFYNYLVNIEGYKNNYLENVLSPNVFSSLEFGYFKINFDLPLNTFGKTVYDKFDKSIDYSEFHKNGMIKIIFEGK